MNYLSGGGQEKNMYFTLKEGYCSSTFLCLSAGGSQSNLSDQFKGALPSSQGALFIPTLYLQHFVVLSKV